MKGLYLRTVYFLHFTSGGSVTHTAGVVNAMAKQIDLEVITNDKLHGVDVPVRTIPAFLKALPVFNEIIYNFWMIQLLKNDFEADFIYQRFSGESFCGARLASHAKIPFVLEFNSSEVWKLKHWSKTKNPLKNILKKYIQLPITQKIEHYNLQKADVIVVVSETLKENLMADGISEHKILVNPNGVDISRFDDADPTNWKAELDLDGKFVFGFIGTFGKWHGVLELAHAIVKFFETSPELAGKVKFLIIGDGKLFPDFQNILKNSPFGKEVICTKSIQQDQSPALLKCCDVFLSPHIPNPDGTKFFGSPTKLFEYMACGKAIIASDLDQIGDILTHRETAFMVKPGDVDELAEAMLHVYQNPDLAAKMGTEARRLVEQKYSWDGHVERILTAIKKVQQHEID